ncbi:hypothetical protein N7455_006043 [Penicillium solitum]|uniref:uncharacterized protein n=1 Tax=Penicillium solitum TaxID=60172 RepID=UPI0032C49853|nr:hypothetical protein N7455_006043 [Penicillium solitum]
MAVIIRMPFLHYAGKPDFLHETTQVSIWSNVEASLGIAAVSLVVKSLDRVGNAESTLFINPQSYPLCHQAHSLKPAPA